MFFYSAYTQRDPDPGLDPLSSVLAQNTVILLLKHWERRYRLLVGKSAIVL